MTEESRRSARQDATVGETVTLEYEVENTGDTPVEQAFGVSTGTTSDRLSGLGVGERRTGNLTTTVPESGVVTLRADDEQAVVELSEANNVDRVTVARPAPEIGVDRRRSNGSLLVTATVTNTGDVPVENGTLIASLPTRNDTKRVGNVSVAPGGTARTALRYPADLRPRESLVLELRRGGTGRTARPLTRRVVQAVQPDLSVDADGVWFHREDGQTYATVYVENTGSGPANGTLRLGTGADANVRELCLDGPTGGERANSAVVRMSAGSLDTGNTVPVVATDPLDAAPGDDGGCGRHPTGSRSSFRRTPAREVGGNPFVR